MNNTSPLAHALDESVAALADAIEVYYRSSGSDGSSSIEVREALSRAMRRLSEASRIEFEQRHAEEAAALPETALEGATWQPEISAVP